MGKSRSVLALNIIASDSISSYDRNLTISDSESINLHSLVATLLNANIIGSGEISVLSRELNTTKFRINESGNINTINMPAYSITVTTSGSGEISVNASHDPLMLPFSEVVLFFIRVILK